MFLACLPYTMGSVVESSIPILDTLDCTVELVSQSELDLDLVNELQVANLEYNPTRNIFEIQLNSMLLAVHWDWFDLGNVAYSTKDDILIFNNREILIKIVPDGFSVNNIMVSRHIGCGLNYIFQFNGLLVLRCHWINFIDSGLFTVILDENGLVESYEKHNYESVTFNKSRIAKMEMMSCL